MTDGQVHPRPMLGQTLDRRNLLIPSDDDCDVSRRSSPAAPARAPGPYADTYAMAVNLVVVESDGSRPDRPDYLGGGEQARRLRAACNRGHGLLRCCVELKCHWLCWGTTSPSIIARDRSTRKSERSQFRTGEPRVPRTSQNWGSRMRITRGSGNVFADLRFADAAERPRARSTNAPRRSWRSCGAIEEAS